MARVGFREEVFDQAHADVVAHAVERGVDGGVFGLGAAGGEREVAAEGGDDGAVGEGDNFGIDFVDAGSLSERSMSVLSGPSREELLVGCASSYFQILRSCQSAGCYYCRRDQCDEGSLFAHTGVSAGRHVFLYDVCTLSSRARRVDSQLITRMSGNGSASQETW